jgi:hypothetical protein
MTPVENDPTLGACPPWSEQPHGHGWEDEWLNGPVRIHTWSRDIAKYHTIRIEEIEQFTTDGRVRRRDVVLDVEAPTQWDIDTAETALRLLGDAIALARNDFPSGTAQ